MNALDFYRQFIEPDDIVFDIGACVGAHTAIFKQLSAKVVSVEPLGEPQLEVINCAVGSKAGYAPIWYSDAKSLGSMSPEWMAAVKKSKRFGSEDCWTKKKDVPVLTLDYLIQKHGAPAFIKIDVEGFELEVLKGLSQPVKTLSFEFTPECLDQTFACIWRCFELGIRQFNISLLESFQLGEWTTGPEIMQRLEQYRDVITTYGDVYARL